jgi:hypothetical protein
MSSFCDAEPPLTWFYSLQKVVRRFRRWRMPFIGLMPSKFFQSQKVNVRINADTWVVGFIVGFVHLASMVTHPPTQRSKFG